MANSTSQAPVTSSAALLVTAPSSGGPVPASYTFQNVGSVDCYLGSTTGVTSATGFVVKAGVAFSLDVWPGDKLYGVTASASTTVHVYGSWPS